MFPVHQAVIDGDVDAVRRLAAAGADLNARDTNEQTPLHLAATANGEGISAMLRALIDLGGRLDVADTSGITPAQRFFLEKCDDLPTARNDGCLLHLTLLLAYWRGSHDRAPAVPGTGAQTLRALRGEPADTDALLDAAETARQRGAWAEARDLLARVCQAHPTAGAVQLARSRVAQKARDTAGAMDAAWWALQVSPELPARWMRMTHLLLQAQQLERAQLFLDAAVQRHPEHADLHYNRACACALRSDRDGLLAAAGAAIALDPAQRADLRAEEDLGAFQDDPSLQALLWPTTD